MKKQLQGILYYITTDIRYSLSIFWAILGGILVLTILLGLFIGGENMTVSFNLSFPIYIFAGIAGFLTVKNTLPYLVKMGATRKNLFIGIVVYFLGLSVVNAAISNVILSATTSTFGTNNAAGLTFYNGDESYHLHHLADILVNDGWVSRMIIDTSVSLFLLSAFFIVGLIFYRYGLIGGFSFIGVSIFIFILGLSNGWLIDFFVHIFSDFSIAFFYQLFLVGVVIYLFSFLLIRRLTI